MNLKDTIAAHAGADRVRVIEVPEWGEPGVPLRIHYRMVTLDDLALANELDGPQWHKQAARIVAVKAMDEQGNRLFKTIDTEWLRSSAAPDVINRVATAMLGRLTVEDARKN